MRVLVTGGNDVLGSSVVAGLSAAGHDVVSADLRFPTSEVDGVTYTVMDLTDEDAVNAGIGTTAPDVVVHLASIVTPAAKDSTRDKAYAVEVDGSRHVLAACLAHDVRRVVVASSGAAYGYHADNPVPLREDDELRGNEVLAHSHHARLVEEQLATLRVEHPELEQVVLRIGTILGEQLDNEVTALFERRRLLRIAGSDPPFVFIWDTDVVAIIQQAVTGGVTGAFNVAGDGTMTHSEIAKALGKRTLVIPEPALRTALRVGHRLHLTPYGPEQARVLRYRPVLDNTRLKAVFGYTPEKTSREAFDAWRMRGQTA